MWHTFWLPILNTPDGIYGCQRSHHYLGTVEWEYSRPGMNSGNHVMLLGDLLPYCYQHLAGIRSAAPGFKEIDMKPAFEQEEVGYVRASHITSYGKVISNWSQTDTGFSWEISVPANSTATIWLPNEDTKA